MRRFIVFLFVLILVVSACGKDDKKETPKDVKVYVALPTALETEQDTINGIQLALSQAQNRAGDVSVELVIFNTGSAEEPYSRPLEEAAAHAAADDSQVVAYIGGSTSGQAKMSIPVLNEAGIAMLATDATWPGLTKPGFGENEPSIYYPTGRLTFFRLAPTDDLQGAVAARFAQQSGYQRIYLVDDGSVYGTGLTGIFEVTAGDLALEIVGHDHYEYASATAETYSEIASRVTEAQPDLVYIGGYATEGGSVLVGALRSLSAELPIMGGDGFAGQVKLVEDNGALAENIYATDISVPVDQLPDAAAFMDLYQQTYNEPATANALSGYEVMQVVLYAIDHADTANRAGVVNELHHLENYSSPRGSWSFDMNGDITLTPMSIVQIQNGEWRFVQVME
jgi:branched-chain amino acid transport system substrate-binding protein